MCLWGGVRQAQPALQAAFELLPSAWALAAGRRPAGGKVTASEEDLLSLGDLSWLAPALRWGVGCAGVLATAWAAAMCQARCLLLCSAAPWTLHVCNDTLHSYSACMPCMHGIHNVLAPVFDWSSARWLILAAELCTTAQAELRRVMPVFFRCCACCRSQLRRCCPRTASGLQGPCWTLAAASTTLQGAHTLSSVNVPVFPRHRPLMQALSDPCV